MADARQIGSAYAREYPPANMTTNRTRREWPVESAAHKPRRATNDSPRFSTAGGCQLPSLSSPAANLPTHPRNGYQERQARAAASRVRVSCSRSIASFAVWRIRP